MTIHDRAYVLIPADVFWASWGFIFVACVCWIVYAWETRDQ